MLEGSFNELYHIFVFLFRSEYYSNAYTFLIAWVVISYCVFSASMVVARFPNQLVFKMPLILVGLYAVLAVNVPLVILFLMGALTAIHAVPAVSLNLCLEWSSERYEPTDQSELLNTVQADTYRPRRKRSSRSNGYCSKLEIANTLELCRQKYATDNTALHRKLTARHAERKQS